MIILKLISFCQKEIALSLFLLCTILKVCRLIGICDISYYIFIWLPISNHHHVFVVIVIRKAITLTWNF
jgi:hypothetical protein